MIRAVLFDLYETLVTERGSTSIRAASLGELLGFDRVVFRELWKRQRPRVIRGELSFGAALMELAAERDRTVA
jgi:hypothetical protein